MAEHPITPPPELRRLWAQQAQRMYPRDSIAWQEHIANQAARWSADPDLWAYVKWIEDCGHRPSVSAAHWSNSMTEHPITPPPELVQQWVANATGPDYEQVIATQAARWGDDQRLKACCEWVRPWRCEDRLRTARRPNPPSLKEQALKTLLEADGADHPVPVLVLPIEDAVVIRRALEALDD